ncbi:hypothetical protein WSM22_42660 [Cytophagales bacterium WSM2-2]|nr:hypothetical protein WSM22_42660 [Cytophagales bacterium WSM2-2]
MHYYTIEMTSFEIKKLEIALMNFTNQNFVRPADCKDLDQIRFFVRKLCLKIEEYEQRFNYVPNWAYSLLAQYNSAHNSLVGLQFTKSYAQ